MAWFLDFFLVLAALVPASALISLAIESAYTGELVLSFERDFLRATDAIAGLAFFLSFVALALYFGRAASGERVTVGQYLMSFRVTVDPSLPGWRRVLDVAFLPWTLIARPIEAKLGIRRPPTFAFLEIEVESIE